MSSEASSTPEQPRARTGFFALVGPGLLVAATGVGVGDLATAGFAGAQLGLAVAWAVVVGAALKLVLTENLARHQIATGKTVLESAFGALGWWVWVPFGLYLLAWSYFVGAALISANAAAASALLGVEGMAWRAGLGIGISVLGAAIVWIGGYRWFERVMGVCALVMVAVVVGAALMVGPDLAALLRGLIIPSVPQSDGSGFTWTIALMGGVGGTLTIVCYGYWMRESGRASAAQLRTIRWDIALGYGVTALFGVAMLVVASPLGTDGSGSALILNLATSIGDEASMRFGDDAGAVARLVFLVGVMGAFFSSLLGVWQCVPLIFCDWLRAVPRRAADVSSRAPIDERAPAYRGYLLALALVPIASLWADFRDVQKVYAIVGALFVPALGLVLLFLNNRRHVGTRLRNGWGANVLLTVSTLVVLALAAGEIVRRLG
ncbi:MAG: Nramp family divalent metal transporter [Planctomycetota bacterium]